MNANDLPQWIMAIGTTITVLLTTINFYEKRRKNKLEITPKPEPANDSEIIVPPQTPIHTAPAEEKIQPEEENGFKGASDGFFKGGRIGASRGAEKGLDIVSPWIAFAAIIIGGIIGATNSEAGIVATLSGALYGVVGGLFWGIILGGILGGILGAILGYVGGAINGAYYGYRGKFITNTNSQNSSE